MKKYTAIIFVLLVTFISTPGSPESDDRKLADGLKFILNAALKGGVTGMFMAYDVSIARYGSLKEYEENVCYVSEEFEDGCSIFKSMAFTPKDFGKFKTLFKDRSAKRLLSLWNTHKNELLAVVPRETAAKMNYPFDTILYYLDFRESPGYSEYVKQFHIWKKNTSELKTDQSHSAVGFWYRRYLEGNSDVVYQILKDIDAHYKINPNIENEPVYFPICNFRRSHWGYTQDKVIKSEYLEPYFKDGRYLKYKIKADGLDAEAVYEFSNGILVNGSIIYNVKSSDDHVKIMNFNYYEYQNNVKIPISDLESGKKNFSGLNTYASMMKDTNTITVKFEKTEDGVHGIRKINEDNDESGEYSENENDNESGEFSESENDNEENSDTLNPEYASAWQSDSNTMLSIISSMRVYRESSDDSTLKAKKKQKQFKEELYKVNKTYYNKPISLKAVRVKDVTAETALSAYGEKRAKELIRLLKKDPSSAMIIGDGSFENNPYLGLLIGLQLAMCKECFKETGRYEVKCEIPVPEGRGYSEYDSGINDDDSSGEENRLIRTEVILIVKSEKKALEFSKGEIIPITGKIKSIEYGSGYSESISIKVE